MARIIMLAVALTFSMQFETSAQNPVDTKLRNEILSYRLPTGPWKNAFKDNREAAGFRYYFVSHGLRAIADDPAAAAAIEAYLSHCLTKADAKTGLWDDVPDFRFQRTKIADADDSNAAMLILLATDFARTPQGQKWWKTNAAKIKKIAELVLLENRLESGLVRVFSMKRKVDDPRYDPAQNKNEPPNDYKARVESTRNFRLALQQSAYLMDSCEVYAALHSLALQLKTNQDQDSDKFDAAAGDVAKAITGLFHDRVGAFYVLDTEKDAFPDYYSDADIKFYPHRLAQVFPELFDVPLGTRDETTKKFDRAWQFATAKGDWAAELPKDGSSDGFPAMARGLIALKRGDHEMARQLFQWYGEQAATPVIRFLMIDQVGFALQIDRGLRKNSK